MNKPNNTAREIFKNTIESQYKFIDDYIAETGIKVDGVLEAKTFDLEHYNSLQDPTSKVMYLLNCKFEIGPDFFSAARKKGIKALTLERYFTEKNKEFAKFLMENNLTFRIYSLIVDNIIKGKFNN